jgi:hypothetical protein
MHFLNSRLLALGLATAASLSLGGCFQSKTRVIEVGDDVGLPSKAFCTTFGEKELTQLPVPERLPMAGRSIVSLRSQVSMPSRRSIRISTSLRLKPRASSGLATFGVMTKSFGFSPSHSR